MTIPNTKYRVSRKKKQSITILANDSNCIEQPFKKKKQQQHTHDGLETRQTKSNPPVSAH